MKLVMTAMIKWMEVRLENGEENDDGTRRVQMQENVYERS